MINSVSQSPAFGKKYVMLVKGEADKATKVVKELFGNNNIKPEGVSAFKGALGNDVNKFLYDGEWGKVERDLLDKLRKQHNMPAFVVVA